MKKTLATAMIALTLLCFFTACKKDESSSGTKPDDIKVIDFSTTRQKEETTLPKADKTIRVSIPAALMGGKANGDIKKYAATHGYEIIRETDGSVTLKMDGMTYSFMLTSVGMDTMMALGDIVDSGDYPYVVRLSDYSSDFSYILMLADKEKYDGNHSYEELAEIVGLCGLYYQYFTTENNKKCEVVIADEKSGEVLYSETYTD